MTANWPSAEENLGFAGAGRGTKAMVAHRVLERHADTAKSSPAQALDHCLDLHGRSSPCPAVRPDDAQRAAHRPAARTETRTSSGCSTNEPLLGQRVVGSCRPRQRPSTGAAGALGAALEASRRRRRRSTAGRCRDLLGRPRPGLRRSRSTSTGSSAVHPSGGAGTLATTVERRRTRSGRPTRRPRHSSQPRLRSSALVEVEPDRVVLLVDLERDRWLLDRHPVQPPAEELSAVQSPAEPFGDARARHPLLVEQRLVTTDPLRGDPCPVRELERDVLPPGRDAETELDVVPAGRRRGVEGDDRSIGASVAASRAASSARPLAICSAS